MAHAKDVVSKLVPSSLQGLKDKHFQGRLVKRVSCLKPFIPRLILESRDQEMRKNEELAEQYWTHREN